MRDLDESSITEAVVARMSGATSARAREISEALVRHLHAFVREIEPSESEWEQAIAFLTETGQRCNDRRQEFILLSDALGVSMLVDALNHRHPGEATETTVLGPFFAANAPQVESGANIAGKLSGPPLLVAGRIDDFKGNPLAGATVDVWHADSDGFYDVQYESGELGGRARLVTDEQGEFQFWSVLPSPYPIPHDGPVGRMLAAQGRHPYRPAHLHFMVTAPGHDKLVTHLFLSGSEYLDSDVVFGVKESLICTLEKHPARQTPDGDRASNPYFCLRADIRLAQEAPPCSRRTSR
jgi:hydroxyquinol 1,2-dioxygenase